MNYMSHDTGSSTKRKTGSDLATRRVYSQATEAELEKFTNAWVRACQREPSGQYLSFAAWVRRALHRQADIDLATP